MTAPKRGYVVLVRARYDGDSAFVASFDPADITTEAEIRRQAFRDAAAMLRALRLDVSAEYVEQMGGEEKSDG